MNDICVLSDTAASGIPGTVGMTRSHLTIHLPTGEYSGIFFVYPFKRDKSAIRTGQPSAKREVFSMCTAGVIVKTYFR